MSFQAAFKDMVHNSGFLGLRPELRSIAKKGRPRVNCPKWYMEGIEQGDFAYQVQGEWKLTERGESILNNSTGPSSEPAWR